MASRRFPGRLPGSVSPLQRWFPGASLGASLVRLPRYNGGLQAPPWAPPWVGFPLTTVASRRLVGRLPGSVSPLQRWPPGASLGASLGSLGLPGSPWAVATPIPERLRSLTDLVHKRRFCGRPYRGLQNARKSGVATPIPERLRSLTDLVHKRPFCGRPYRGVHSRPPPVHLSCTSRPPPVHLQSERAA